MQTIEVSREKYSELSDKYAEIYSDGEGQDISDALGLLRELGIAEFVVG